VRGTILFHFEQRQTLGERFHQPSEILFQRNPFITIQNRNIKKRIKVCGDSIGELPHANKADGWRER
jgi:hypothetical protein